MSSGTWSAGNPASGPELLERSDAELLAASRTGDNSAYSELWRRHQPAALALAKRLTGHPSDADDLVNEAFVKVLSALRNGNGPTSAMRPYLLTAVRRLNVDRALAGQKVQPTDDMSAHDPGQPFVDPALKGLENSLVAAAYRQLPERWQMVLWHTEVEEMSPKDVAPLLGMSPNAVAALALRARAGLREAYLVAHIRTSSPECELMLPKLAAYVRGSAAPRERAAVERHLPDCEDCRMALAELQDVGGRMRAVVAPLVLGTAAALYLSDLAALPALAVPAQAGAAAAVAQPPSPGGSGTATGGAGATAAAGSAGPGAAGAGAGAGAAAAAGAAAGATGWVMAGAAGLVVMGVVVGTITLNNRAEESAAQNSSVTASASPSPAGEQPGEHGEAPPDAAGGQAAAEGREGAGGRRSTARPTGAEAGPGERVGSGTRQATASNQSDADNQDAGADRDTALPRDTAPERTARPSTPGAPAPVRPPADDTPAPLPSPAPGPPAEPPAQTPTQPPAPTEPPTTQPPPTEPPPTEPPGTGPTGPTDTTPTVSLNATVTVASELSSGAATPLSITFPAGTQDTSVDVRVSAPLSIDNTVPSPCEIDADRLTAKCTVSTPGTSVTIPVTAGPVTAPTRVPITVQVSRSGAVVTVSDLAVTVQPAPEPTPEQPTQPDQPQTPTPPGTSTPPGEPAQPETPTTPGPATPPASEPVPASGTVTPPGQTPPGNTPPPAPGQEQPQGSPAPPEQAQLQGAPAVGASGPITGGAAGSLVVTAPTDGRSPGTVTLDLTDGLSFGPDGPCRVTTPVAAVCDLDAGTGSVLVPVVAGDTPAGVLVPVHVTVVRGAHTVSADGTVQVLPSPGPADSGTPASGTASWSETGQLSVTTASAAANQALPAGVRRAQVFWAANSAARKPVTLISPNGTRHQVLPATVRPVRGFRGFTATADVTSLVRATPGTWTVAGTAQDQPNPWTLVAVSDDPAAPEGVVELTLVGTTVRSGAWQFVPSQEEDAQTLVVGLGGDARTVLTGGEASVTGPFSGPPATVSTGPGEQISVSATGAPAHVTAVVTHAATQPR